MGGKPRHVVLADVSSSDWSHSVKVLDSHTSCEVPAARCSSTRPRCSSIWRRGRAMSARQVQRRSAALLRDGGLLRALRAELAHELSSSPSHDAQASEGEQVGSSVSMGPFTVEWDDPGTKDVVLKRRHGEPGGREEEEVAVSAALGPVVLVGVRGAERALPHHALMKVCIKKPGASPVVRFDCTVYTPAWLRLMEAAVGPDVVEEEEDEVEEDNGSCDFRIYNAFYYPSAGCADASTYRVPAFSNLDPQLQGALKEYLVARGIGEEFITFLLQHLIKREQGQYVNWLRALEAFVSKDA